MGESLTLYKLIVLYMLEKVDFPLTNAQISGFILDKGYTTYFHLQQALSELTESELIHCETIRNSSYFSITKSGEQTLEYFGKEIPKEIKGEIAEFFKNNAMEIKEELSTFANYYRGEKEGYQVRCSAKEKEVPLIELTMTVPTKAAAEAVCASWQTKIKPYMKNCWTCSCSMLSNFFKCSCICFSYPFSLG